MVVLIANIRHVINYFFCATYNLDLKVSLELTVHVLQQVMVSARDLQRDF